MSIPFKSDKLIVILGPTAVGKTALSLSLAKRLKSEIISGDSMLVYRGFDIGTAKPTKDEQRSVKHHLIDILPPTVSYNVTNFQTQAGKCIRDLNEKHVIPIVAGGTGLYIKALLEDYVFCETGEHPAFREKIKALAEIHGRKYIFERLKKESPKAAAHVDEKNFSRVVRALEVATFGNEDVSTARNTDAELVCRAFVVGLRRDRAVLYERIHTRVDQMIAEGLVSEVKGLLTSGIPVDAPALKGIGYKEIAAALTGDLTLEEAIETVKKNTRHFAKRQFTWYRKMPYIHWYDLDTRIAEEAEAQIFRDIIQFFSLTEK